MTILIILIIYISGVYKAYFQIQQWSDNEPCDREEWHALFKLSLASWFIYLIYGLNWLFHKFKEE